MLEVVWAGWYNKGTSDKLWGVIRVDSGDYFNFWCRRGAKMQFKKTNTNRYSHKEDRGYERISKERLEQIYPGFIEEANQQLVYGLLTNSVRGTVGYMYDD